MKMHNMVFITFGIIGLLLMGAGQVLIKNSVKEVPRSPHASFGPNIQGLSLCDDVFGSSYRSVRQTDSTQRTVGVLVALLAHVLVAVGAAFHAAGKNRSPWFGLLGLLTPIGLLFLTVLEDKSTLEGNFA